MSTTHGTDRLVDFPSLATRLFWTGVVVAAAAVVGATLQGLLDGLTFAVLVQWGVIGVVMFVLAAAMVAALHALGGARHAQRRGESLSSPDVGLRPRRLGSLDPDSGGANAPRARSGDGGNDAGTDGHRA